MLHLLFIARRAALGAICACASAASLAAQEVLLDGPIAIINDRVITQRDLLKKARALAGERGSLEESQLQAFQLLVREALLAQAKLAAGLNERIIDERVKQRMRLAEEREGGRAQFQAMLASRGETIEAHYERLAAEIRQGVTFDSLALQTGPTGRPAADPYVSPRKLELWYRRHPEMFREPGAVKARLCLAPLAGEAQAQAAEERARRWLAEVLAGRDFAELAKAESGWNPSGSGELSGAVSGEPEWVAMESPGELDPELRRVLEGRAVGVVPEVIRMRDGYAVAAVLSVRPASRRPFSDPDVQSQIERTIQEEWYQAQRIATEVELQAKSYVWIRRTAFGGR